MEIVGRFLGDSWKSARDARIVHRIATVYLGYKPPRYKAKITKNLTVGVITEVDCISHLPDLISRRLGDGNSINRSPSPLHFETYFMGVYCRVGV